MEWVVGVCLGGRRIISEVNESLEEEVFRHGESLGPDKRRGLPPGL